MSTIADIDLTEPIITTCGCCDKPFLIYPNKKKKGFILKDVIIREKYGKDFYLYDRRKDIEQINSCKESYTMITSLKFATVYDTKEEAEVAFNIFFPEGNACKYAMEIVDFEEELKNEAHRNQIE
jgi:hypothetical protein